MSARGDHASARGTDLVEFFAPLPLAAVALLAVNDHLLKPRFHNELTGKLSDLALCFFLPLYLSALIGIVWRGRPGARLAIGAALTAAAFTAVELWDAAGRALSALMIAVGGPFGIGPAVLTRDLSDLLTLAMVPLAIAYGRRRATAAPAGGAP